MSIFNEFPYTNFHEMNLDWIIARVKEWLAIAENWEKWKDDMEAAFEDLKDYVDSYFDNLDFRKKSTINLMKCSPMVRLNAW